MEETFVECNFATVLNPVDQYFVKIKKGLEGDSNQSSIFTSNQM